MKIKEIVTIMFLASLLILPCVSAKPKKDYNTITEGEIFYSAGHYLEGQPIPTGYDDYGYNYQGHLFKGSYFNVYSGGAGFPPYTGDDESYLDENPGAASHWAWPYRSTKLVMKWNEAWLSNVDRDLDGKLDRPSDYGGTYIGSGAWETNHMWDSYVGDDGREHRWNSFTKIVAAPSDAYSLGGYWYEADGTEMGTVIWGQFAVIFDVYNDPYGGYHGVSYDAPAPTGFGYYKP